MKKILILFLCVALAGTTIAAFHHSALREQLNQELETARLKNQQLSDEMAQARQKQDEEMAKLLAEQVTMDASLQLLQAEHDALILERKNLTAALSQARDEAMEMADGRMQAEHALVVAQEETEAALLQAKADAEMAVAQALAAAKAESEAQLGVLARQKEAAERRLSEAMAILTGASPTPDDQAMENRPSPIPEKTPHLPETPTPPSEILPAPMDEKVK